LIYSALGGNHRVPLLGAINNREEVISRGNSEGKRLEGCEIVSLTEKEDIVMKDSQSYWKATKRVLIFGISVCFVVLSAVNADAKKLSLSVAGAGIGQSSYIQAAALADYVNKHSDKLSLTAQTTRGFVHNSRLVNSGDTELGFCSTTIIYPALLGIEKFKEGKFKNLRGVINSGESMHYWITLKSKGINSIKDMAGKRINTGTPGSNTRYIARLTLRAYGVFDTIHESSLNFPGSASALIDGKIDAWCAAGAPPASTVVEVFSARDGKIIGIDDYMFDKFIKNYPMFGVSKLLANTYKGQTKDVPVLGYQAYLLANKDVPEWVTYEILKIIMTPEAKRELRVASVKWKALNAPDVPKLQGMSQVGLKLHPGAERFWREKGLTIPANISILK